MSAISDWLFLLATRGTSGVLILSWQALILILCVGLGLKIFRVKAPTLRHQVWLLTLIATVMLPAASALTRRFPVLQPRATVVSYLIEAPHSTLSPAASAANEPAQGALRSRLLQAVPPGALVFVIWLIGALTTLARLAWEQVTLRRIRRHARIVTLSELDIFGEALVSRHVR